MASAFSKRDIRNLRAYGAKRKAERRAERAAKTAARLAAEPTIAEKIRILGERRIPRAGHDCSISAMRLSLARISALLAH